MEDIVRGWGPKVETRWAETSERDEYRDWLSRIHREAVEHTETILARQGTPAWMKA